MKNQKPLKISAISALMYIAMSGGANAAVADTSTLNITGTVKPAACTIDTPAAHDFGDFAQLNNGWEIISPEDSAPIGNVDVVCSGAKLVYFYVDSSAGESNATDHGSDFGFQLGTDDIGWNNFQVGKSGDMGTIQFATGAAVPNTAFGFGDRAGTVWEVKASGPIQNSQGTTGAALYPTDGTNHAEIRSWSVPISWSARLNAPIDITQDHVIDDTFTFTLEYL